ncbi:MAG: ABC transporter permease, partial [Gemmatimonadota bacterium]
MTRRSVTGGPPFLAGLLLTVFLRGEEREVICGDLEEEYRDRLWQWGGAGPAKRWYWRQALGVVSRRTWARFGRIGGAIGGGRDGSHGAPGPGWQDRKGAKMREIGQDVRFGLRALGRRPMFVVVAGLTLALGVGANTAMFSVLNTVLLRPLDYPAGDRIVQVWGWRALSKSTLVEIEQGVRAFSSVSGFASEQFALTGGGVAEELPGAVVSPDHFAVMGVAPVLGRGFTAEDSEPGHGDVVILSDEMWRTRYGASPDIVGSSITLAGTPHVVVGVMPAGYRPVRRGWRVWVPMTIDPTDFGDWAATAGTTVLARLAADATPDRATAELEPIARAIQAENPDVFDDVFVAQATATPLLDAAVNGVRGTLWLLLGAVGLVLLIACANVANLLLAQGGSRAREMAIRQSQGASGGRLVRQLLTESVLLAALSGVIGLLLSAALLSLLRHQLEGSLPRGSEIGVDYRVLLFAAGISLLTALAFGLLPALRTARADVNRHLRDGSRRGTARGHRGMNRVLVGLEVATSLVLLSGAGL